MKKYTYEVYTTYYSWDEYRSEVEETIDRYAKKGWRLNSFSSFEHTDWNGDPDGIHVTFIFEKEAED